MIREAVPEPLSAEELQEARIPFHEACVSFDCAEANAHLRCDLFVFEAQSPIPTEPVLLLRQHAPQLLIEGFLVLSELELHELQLRNVGGNGINYVALLFVGLFAVLAYLLPFADASLQPI